MIIQVDNIQQQFLSNYWVIKNFSYEFKEGVTYGVVGKNGCGKSTLMKIIAGYYIPTFGQVRYQHAKKNIPEENFFHHYILSAPDLVLIEEFSLQALLAFHFTFKKPINDWSIQKMVTWLEMNHYQHQPIHYLSSGLKQKIKLGLCFLTDVPIILLDEPMAYLDTKNIQWYQEHIQVIMKKKLIIIFSNHPKEYALCDDIIALI